MISKLYTNSIIGRFKGFKYPPIDWYPYIGEKVLLYNLAEGKYREYTINSIKKICSDGKMYDIVNDYIDPVFILPILNPSGFCGGI